jgi:3-hydroxyisobutyrate dehydrogenase
MLQRALSQNCLFEAKSENRVLENQGLASPNFPVFGNLRQSPYKDFRLAGDLATKHGVPTRLLDLCQLELLEAMNRGWGDQDRTRASTLQEERAGVKLRLSAEDTA